MTASYSGGVVILTPTRARLIVTVSLVATATCFVTLHSLALFDEARVQAVNHVKFKCYPQLVDSLRNYFFWVGLAYLLTLILLMTIGAIWAIFARRCHTRTLVYWYIHLNCLRRL